MGGWTHPVTSSVWHCHVQACSDMLLIYITLVEPRLSKKLPCNKTIVTVGCACSRCVKYAMHNSSGLMHNSIEIFRACSCATASSECSTSCTERLARSWIVHMLDTRTLVMLLAVVSPLGLSCNGLMVGDAALCIYDRDWEGRLKLLDRLAMVLDDFLCKLLDILSESLPDCVARQI